MKVKDFHRITVEQIRVCYNNQDIRIDLDDFLMEMFGECHIDFIETDKDGALLLHLKMEFVKG